MDKLQTFGTAPSPRFGHTVEVVSKTKAILFGGAIGSSKGFRITNETYSFDLMAKFWRKIDAQNSVPGPRAAHAATTVRTNQMYVYGGTTGESELAADDLYMLDLKQGEENATWYIVPVAGTTPGRRYGHTMVFADPCLVIFGGTTGKDVLNDVWSLDLGKRTLTWQKIAFECEVPIPRLYHSASICQDGRAKSMILIFGGRSAQQVALNDAWGLVRHRTGAWDWIKAPYSPNTEQPYARYQHSSVFVGSMLVVMGGRTSQGGWNPGTEIFDTGTSDWHRVSGIQTYRHVSWIVGGDIYSYGGLELNVQNSFAEGITRIKVQKAFEGNRPLLETVEKYLEPIRSSLTSPCNSSTNDEQRSAISYSPPNDSLDTSFTEHHQHHTTHTPKSENKMKSLAGLLESRTKEVYFGSTVEIALAKQVKGHQEIVKQHMYLGKPTESKKGYESYPKFTNLQIPKTLPVDQNIASMFLNQLLRPKEYLQTRKNEPFKFKPELIIELCDQAESVIQNQPIVVRPESPAKIFGDIHGQYSDLMRFFDLFGSPCDADGQEGDIDRFDYVFLGDYVDRGSHSLETICLLLALKIKYPNQVYLLRGNHEERWINLQFGFIDECGARIGEDPTEQGSVYQRINSLFEWLPLAAVIDDKILCVHGGIGYSFEKIEEIEKLERPLEIVHDIQTKEEQLLMDVLWSDPTESDQVYGIQPNRERDPGDTGNIVRFGPDRVQTFLLNNDLSMIIRAHECVMDGVERFAAGMLVTVFSATDYCGKHKNAGAMLVLKKNGDIIPKLIYPMNAGHENWIEDDRRPPTPPRWRNTQQRKGHIAKSYQV